MPRRGGGRSTRLGCSRPRTAVRVQRDGHDHIRAKLPPGLGHDIGGPRGKPVARARHLLVLQQRAGADERVVVDRLAARGYRRNERATTARAHRFRDFKERCKAGLADRNPARIRERLAADAGHGVGNTIAISASSARCSTAISLVTDRDRLTLAQSRGARNPHYYLRAPGSATEHTLPGA